MNKVIYSNEANTLVDAERIINELTQELYSVLREFEEQKKENQRLKFQLGLVLSEKKMQEDEIRNLKELIQENDNEQVKLKYEKLLKEYEEIKRAKLADKQAIINQASRTNKFMER
jgi:hypothetical protein